MNTLKVLLVDDEEDFVTTLSERLQLRGIQAQSATDGESALRMIEDSPPQVAVVDVMMPGISGIEVLKRIKDQNPQIPVILLTGHGSTKEGIKGMQLGAFDYLMKPLNIDELIKKMEEAVKVS
ncbi:MAG: response regulator [Thermodesulfobacteriota bacterium]|nr:response regulator [Thermodesulfobacteriota bacterium]